jgi:galactonate dehydratase
LRSRELNDYLRAVEAALALGAQAVKVAPFEAVTREGDQLAQAQEGFARIEAVRRRFPKLSLRLDCHERFTPANAAKLMARFSALSLDWLEEPIPTGPDLGPLRATAKMPFAIGELFFGEARFRELLDSRWADVIMPDPKHVGGFGPLINVCRLAESRSAQVSPHNPSGPVATAVALHAAAISQAVTNIEVALTSDSSRQPGSEFLKDGRLRIPDSPGWGLPEKITKALRTVV